MYGRKGVDWDRRYTVFHWKIEQLPPVPMIQFDCRKFAIDSVVLLYHFLKFTWTIRKYEANWAPTWRSNVPGRSLNSANTASAAHRCDLDASKAPSTPMFTRPTPG